MKMYENGGGEYSRYWSVRFLSKHDSGIIHQIGNENHDRFMEECGGGYSTEGDRMIFAEKDRPE